MGLKQGVNENTHGEHIGNMLEQRKNEKNLPLSPPQNLKGKSCQSFFLMIILLAKWVYRLVTL
jgi:hypothetical protein